MGLTVCSKYEYVSNTYTVDEVSSCTIHGRPIIVKSLKSYNQSNDITLGLCESILGNIKKEHTPLYFSQSQFCIFRFNL